MTAYMCSVHECVVEEGQPAMKSEMENDVTRGCEMVGGGDDGCLIAGSSTCKLTRLC